MSVPAQVLNSQPAPTDKGPAPAPTPDPAPTPKPDDAAAKFAALAKKERIARLAQVNLRNKEAQLAEREKKLEAQLAEWENEFKSSPLEAIKKRGYTYEDITKAALNDGRFDPATEVKGVKEEIARLRQEQADKDKKAQDSQKTAQEQAEAQAIDDFKASITSHVEANPDKYEFVALYGASELVYQTVEEHFKRTQKVLSKDEACELVEKYLETEQERIATSSKKFQGKYGGIKASKDEPPRIPPKSTTTLTNELTSTAPSMLPAATEADRIKRALAKLSK